MMKLYNTLSRKIEEFKPIKSGEVGMYTCGPTVYWSTHIGHMSKYVGDDLLRRVLAFNNYKVRHVMNITDVGHLTSDADEGEDKMEKGAARENLSVWDIAKKYEKEFFDTMDRLNVLRPDIICRATEHIPEQVALIEKLESKGYTYQTDAAIYFDVSKFPDYEKLSGQKLEEKVAGTREGVATDSQKKSPYDFALWMKCVGRFEKHIMRWNSPWGKGFPGWHVECSAMSMKYLGERFDIHTGGIDHIGVHHPAEIAQSEAATGKKPFVKYWVHRVFILVNGQKMSKSLNNFYELKDVVDKGLEPLAVRYLFLTGHYRQAMNFTWEALAGAQTALDRLRKRFLTLPWSLQSLQGEALQRARGQAEIEQEFLEATNDDLNMPKALAVAWKAEDQETLLKFDEVLGLKLEVSGEGLAVRETPEEIRKLLEMREKLRAEKKFSEADKLREEIIARGFKVMDK